MPEPDIEVDRLNAEMPVGTRVRYYPGPRWFDSRLCEIRDTFHRLTNGQIVGWVTGTPGYVDADHIVRAELTLSKDPACLLG